MCYQGKCLMCIPAKSGCLVLAILSAIFTGLALSASVISGVVYATGGAVFAQIAGGGIKFNSLPAIVILITGIYSLIAFIFSMLLCNGIRQRRPGQVKAYFIYGVTMTVLYMVIVLAYLINNLWDAGTGVVVLLECGIYCLFLRLVHQTYFLLLEEAAPKYYIPHAATQPQGPYCA